ncbi:PTS system sucrose-specific EIIBC component [Dissostichus eleginoides]|uniref:PTS system sucrose-specific EIIBC component n=1 Tax=Dissostichus eleginoides TaxID=100907 RepID=A0AAD9BVH7_DISEL|nr:PTS system sucrose-specific EIIBC component [Dissostichus eleginoides]
MSNQQQRERGGNPGGGALVGPDCQQHPARSTGGRPGAGIPTLNGLGFHLVVSEEYPTLVYWFSDILSK